MNNVEYLAQVQTVYMQKSLGTRLSHTQLCTGVIHLKHYQHDRPHSQYHHRQNVKNSALAVLVAPESVNPAPSSLQGSQLRPQQPVTSHMNPGRDSFVVVTRHTAGYTQGLPAQSKYNTSTIAIPLLLTHQIAQQQFWRQIQIQVHCDIHCWCCNRSRLQSDWLSCVNFWRRREKTAQNPVYYQ